MASPHPKSPICSLGDNSFILLIISSYGVTLHVLRASRYCNSISKDYLSENENNSISDWLHNPNTIFSEGQGRHKWMLYIVNSYFWKYSGEWLELSDEDRFERAWQWHLDHCKPPRTREEFDKICRDVTRKFAEERDKKHDEISSRKKSGEYAEYGPEINAELEGNTFYRINEKPPKFIIAYHQTKKLIEAALKTSETERLVNGQKESVKLKYLTHTKTYLTCIPIKIVRHKNPLSFLDIAQNIPFLSPTRQKNILHLD